MLKKNILIDLDDVICNYAFLSLVNKMTNSNFTYDDTEEYMLDTLIKDENIRSEFLKEAVTTDIYQDAKFLPDAYKVLKELNKHYEIYICSACVTVVNKELCGTYHMYKYNYIIRELPFLKPENFIFTNSKQLFNADYQIDDRFENLQGKGVKNKFLFDSYHNKNYDDKFLKRHKIKRVNSWQEIAKIFLGHEVK